MAKLCGGMDFQAGSPVALAPPADRMAGEPLRLSCDGELGVGAGQSVDVGQPIQQSPTTIVSPISATVDALYPWQDAQGRAWVDVVLAPRQDAVMTTWEVDPPDGLERSAWRDALDRTGPWVESGVDLVQQLASDESVDHVICVGLDAFSPYPDRSSLIRSFGADVVLGAQVWGQIMGAKRITLIVDQAAGGRGDLRRLCRGLDVHLRTQPNVYPGADPRLLIPRDTRGRSAKSACVGLIAPWSAVRLARWLTRRKLDLVQPMWIAWPRSGQLLTPRFAFPGQTLATLDPALAGRADELVNRVVQGNPMTGQAFQAPRFPPDADACLEPVVRAGEHLIAVLPGITPPPPSSCIACGWCVDVCPARLRPIHLLKQLDVGTANTSASLDACIDCGLCSHVCPSSIPIAQQLRAHQVQTLHGSNPEMPLASSPEAAASDAVPGPPWIGGAHHKTRIDLHWLIVATILLAWGGVHFGASAWTLVAWTSLGALASHHLLGWLFKSWVGRPSRRVSPYALWTGMLLGLCLPATTPAVLAGASGLLLGIVNHLVGRSHRVRIHPAALVLVGLWSITPLLPMPGPTASSDPQQVMGAQYLEMLEQPGRLRYLLSSGQLAPFEKLSLGAVPGPVGVTSPLLLMLLGLYLIYLRLASFRGAALAMGSALGVVLLWPMHVAGGWYPLAWLSASLGPAGAITFISYLLFASPLCLIVFLLAPVGAPMSHRGRTIYSLLIGGLTMGCILVSGQPQAGLLAPVVMGLLSRPLDALHRLPASPATATTA